MQYLLQTLQQYIVQYTTATHKGTIHSISSPTVAMAGNVSLGVIQCWSSIGSTGSVLLQATQNNTTPSQVSAPFKRKEIWSYVLLQVQEKANDYMEILRN